MKRAFTLVEMVIVIGILAALAALLLPAVSRAREQAKSVKCLSNLRQLAQAAFAYVEVYDGSFPLSTQGGGLEWDFDSRSTPIRPGILWMGATTLSIHQCPSYDGRSGTKTDPFTGYNYNTSYIGGGVGETTPLGTSHVAPARIHAVHDPARVALFGDGQYWAGSDKFMRAPILMAGTNLGDGVDLASRLAGTQGYRHLGRTNVCYCDGHAESVAARYLNSGTSNGRSIASSPADVSTGNSGFLSADNSAYGGH